MARRFAGTRKATMADVGERAGVTAQTVSRTLRNPQCVTEEVRARIFDAVEVLGYVRDLAASHLATGSSKIVAAIIPSIETSIFAQTIRGLSDTLGAEGYQLIIGNSDYSLEREADLVRAFLGRRPDALVLTGNRHTPAVRTMVKQAALPTVETWSTDGEFIDVAVGFSNRAAGRAMTAELIRRGYRAPVFVGPTHDDARAESRRQGFEDALTAAGHGRARFFPLEAPHTASQGGACIDAVRALFPECDAIFFSGDRPAIGALLSCRKKRIRVPRDIAIVGFGDYELSGQCNPALTTVAIPSRRIGEQAAQSLLARLQGKRVEAIIDVGFELKLRESA